MSTITSLLDTDLYKLTMQAAVLQHFPDAQATFLFKNRTPAKQLNDEAVLWLKQQIAGLGELRFAPDEIAFLKKHVGFLPEAYFEYLKTCKLDPSKQVKVDVTDGQLEIEVSGPWKDTILYEIPLLALVSEAYFKFVDKDWSYDGQTELAANKAKQLIANGCVFSEFGTRRRRSLKTHDIVIAGILDGLKTAEGPGIFTGTSNVFLAKKYDLKPIGTVAHEWMMGVAAATGDYSKANLKAMELWIETVGDANAGVALTDTFGTESFLTDFKKPLTEIYNGVRQDSGDPLDYTKLLGDHYKSLGYEPMSKVIVYSDSLDVDKCAKYKAAAAENGLKAAFGVGTYFTNDFKRSDGEKSTPLNIVIKIQQLNGKSCIKLSDNLSKNMGDPETVERVKRELGYVEKGSVIDESKRWN
ncbi:putative nicotinate phosphoribosyltransferase [Yarrowia sp. B02]|nr:putative nicotinate phosphoribosyltransferase [Yarrowia sp. B02]